ncbi:MAG: dienelactone hydrolase family protein [Elainellaceae cyanobacterium]
MSTPIKSQYVQLISGESTIPAYRAMPNESPVAGVVVLQEIFGVNEHIREVTEGLARCGYAAIAPALYQRQVADFEAGYTPEDIRVGREYKVHTAASELLLDVQAAVEHLQSHMGTYRKVGCIGFCFGGHVAYLAATLPSITATASFYGAGIATWCPGEESPTVTRTPQISGTLYGFFGKDDASIPEAEVTQIEAALTAAGVPHRIFRYDNAGHGFFCDRRDSYCPEAAAKAWKQVLDLFKRLLQ